MSFFAVLLLFAADTAASSTSNLATQYFRYERPILGIPQTGREPALLSTQISSTMRHRSWLTCACTGAARKLLMPFGKRLRSKPPRKPFRR